MRPPSLDLGGGRDSHLGRPGERRGGSHLRRSGTGEPFPETLAWLHNAFEQVHPFLDGYGRTGRLTLNLILERLRYPPGPRDDQDDGGSREFRCWAVPWLAFTRDLSAKRAS